jgi:hypothetical protein
LFSWLINLFVDSADQPEQKYIPNSIRKPAEFRTTQVTSLARIPLQFTTQAIQFRLVSSTSQQWLPLLALWDVKICLRCDQPVDVSSHMDA